MSIGAGSVVLDVVRTDLIPPCHLSFFLEIPVVLSVTRGLDVTERIELTAASGPIRIQVSASEPLALRVASARVSVWVLGMPGPDGRLGPVGPQGPVGPMGNLDAGIVVDGGNF